MSFMSDFKDRLEKIPPWGYAAIAGGVLLLAFLNSKDKGTENERVIYSVAAGNEVPQDDSKYMDLQDRLMDKIGMIEDRVIEGDDKFLEELDNLRGKIDELKNPVVSGPSYGTPAPQPVTTPASHTVGYGVGTANPGEPKKASAGLAAYQSGDMSALQAEIDRARDVIAYRTANGMDTSAQTKYLNSLLKLP